MSTKENILDALVQELEDISEVEKATRFTLSLKNAEENNPYIGVVSREEIPIVEDSTDIRYSLSISLFIITEEQYKSVETLIGKIKDLLEGTGICPISIHANLMMVKVESTDSVMLEDLDDEAYSSVVVNLTLIYYASKTGF